MTNLKLSESFFLKDAREVGINLLGKILVRNYNNITLMGRIVETEAYIGSIDKASHAFGNKKTPRVLPLYEKGGIAYVYKIYGMYNCMNVVTGDKNHAQGVLIRALEPISGLDTMSQNRFNKEYNILKSKEIINLTSGPGKLCIALNIDRSLTGHSLLSSELFIIDDGNNNYPIKKGPRIGIDYAEEAREFPWRYYIENNKYVSR